MAETPLEISGSPVGAPAPDHSWKWPVLLALPILICLAVLLITGWTFPTFWGADEVAHWALIQWFAEGLPRFTAVYPASATTPFFHLAGAVIVRLCGPHLQVVRACNALLSVGGILMLYRLLRRTFAHESSTAALLAAVLLFSSFYFGYAFRALTDNMAIFGCILAMGELFRFADPAEPRPLLRYSIGCLWCGVAILTRQSYVFLCIPFGLALLASARPWQEKIAGAAGVGLALAPYAALIAAWHGLVPPAYQEHHTPNLINLYPLELPMMLLGMYAPFFCVPTLVRRWRAGTLPAQWWVWPVVAAGLALAVLAWFPLFPVRDHPELTPYFPADGVVDWGKYFGGWLYSAADRSGRWTIFHNSILFWLALPSGAAALAMFAPEAWRAATDPLRRTAVLFLAGVLFTSMLNSISAQKYYDGLVLLFLIWHSRGEAARDVFRRGFLLTLIAGFCLYAAAFPKLSNTAGLLPGPPPAMPPPP